MRGLASIDPKEGPCRTVPDQTNYQRDSPNDICGNRRRPCNDMKEAKSQQPNSNYQPNCPFFPSNILGHDLFPFSDPEGINFSITLISSLLHPTEQMQENGICYRNLLRI
jgi:hypothetical protein